MTGISKDIRQRAAFHHLPGIHDTQIVTHPGYHTQVVCNEDVGGLVPVDDPDSLAQAIIREIKNNTKQSKGVYANQYAYENFTWKKQVGKMISLYRQAIDAN